MLNKNIKMMFLFLTLIVLLVGVVSAQDISSDSSTDDNVLGSTVKDISIIENKNIVKKDNSDNIKMGTSLNSTGKSSTTDKPYTTTAKTYNELVSKVNQAKKSDYTSYTINLQKGTYTATQKLVWDDTKTASKLVINGNSSVIDGLKKYQFLEIGSEYTVNLKNITLKNFKADDGGAIDNEGTLIITNSKLINNNASEDGGAIYSSGDLTITNSQLSYNTAGENGGAIYLDETEGSIINSNSFTRNIAGEDGGAIYIYDSYDTSIKYNNFTKNLAKDDGGAIANTPRSESYTYMGQEPYTVSESYLEQYWNPAKSYGIIGYTTTYNYNPMGYSTPIQIPQYGSIGGYDYRTAYRYVTKYRTVTKTGYHYYGSDTTIQNNNFIENKAEDEAAAILVSHGNVNLTKNKFHRNKDNVTKESIENDGEKITKNVYKYSTYGNPILDEGNTNITQNTFDDRKDTTITISNINTAYYGKKLIISGKLLNNKNALKSQNITITFNNKKYTVKTNKTGYFTLNLITNKVGKNTLKLSYAGNNNYLSTSTSKVVTVNKRITKVTITKIPQKKLNDKITITGKFTTKEGNTLKNTTLTIKFNSKTYKVVTNSKGVYTKKVVASKVGTNTVSVTFKGNSKYKAITSKTTFKTVKN